VPMSNRTIPAWANSRYQPAKRVIRRWSYDSRKSAFTAHPFGCAIDDAWLREHFGSAARPRPRTDGSAEPLHALAEALRGQLRKRDAEIATLKADVAALRAETAVAKRLDEFESNRSRRPSLVFQNRERVIAEAAN